MLNCNKFVVVIRSTDKVPNEILQEGNLKHREPWTTMKNEVFGNL